jgi:hypothetical protein
MGTVADYRLGFEKIPGWFGAQDYWMFEFFLEAQSLEPPGDLLEMGPYLGRSAILLGLHQRVEEHMTVCDLFGQPLGDAANIAENAEYGDVAREAFERNYRDWVGRLPTIIQAPTAELAGVLPHGRHRFVHVDASHLYEQVRQDLATAVELLRPGGVVACDDFRSPHTPGTAAAVWEAVLGGTLQPVCVSQQKFYGVKGDAEEWRRRLLATAAQTGRIGVEIQAVAGHDLIRVYRPRESLVGARQDRVERLFLPPALKERIDRRRLAQWMLRWAREQPLIAAEVSGITGIDLLAARNHDVRPPVFASRRNVKDS